MAHLIFLINFNKINLENGRECINFALSKENNLNINLLKF